MVQAEQLLNDANEREEVDRDGDKSRCNIKRNCNIVNRGVVLI